MSTPNDGGPAFPISERDEYGHLRITGGMTLRDKFAESALQGLLASNLWPMREREIYADVAYMMADAMIERRQRQ